MPNIADDKGGNNEGFTLVAEKRLIVSWFENVQLKYVILLTIKH
jgi:hypothetical protein